MGLMEAPRRLVRSKAKPDVLPADGLYLDRCQVDTPDALVRQVWTLLHQRRGHFSSVVDFGAGDGRFAQYGAYDSYCGYEVDPTRCVGAKLPLKAHIKNVCAFSDIIRDASLSIGNPPFVRNQDLPAGWRDLAASAIEARTGFRVPGLANAWQYFFLHSLASTAADGMVALVIPFEWVSRPSAEALRQYIKAQNWNVCVYRLADRTFDHVLTTSSITIVDKANRDGKWTYFRQEPTGATVKMRSPSGGRQRVLGYSKPMSDVGVRAKRGLSPGTQEFLTLTEGERVGSGLQVGRDVVACLTTLRHTESVAEVLDVSTFRRDYVLAGKKCWLIRADRRPGERLQAYLDSVPRAGRQSATCSGRGIWWKFAMPTPPDVLIASGFRDRPKVFINALGAVAVGGLCGIYGIKGSRAKQLVRKLRTTDYSGRVVAHSNGLRKLEINQMNELISTMLETK